MAAASSPSHAWKYIITVYTILCYIPHKQSSLKRISLKKQSHNTKQIRVFQNISSNEFWRRSENLSKTRLHTLMGRRGDHPSHIPLFQHVNNIEVVLQTCTVKKMFLKIRVQSPFFNKLQVSGISHKKCS